MERELLDIIMRYAQEAGRIAVSEQQRAAARLKPDATYVTDVDLRLSELAFKLLSSAIPERQIITEEHLDNLEALTRDGDLDSVELLAVVDPIDGTRNYYHNMPLYGLSAGILRNLEPWLGVVAFPALGETFCFDGTEARVILETGGGDPVRQTLEPFDAELNTNAVILCANSFARRYRWRYDVCTMMLTACVTVNCCWPLLGRGVGSVFTDHIWDIAGSWPLLHRLGFELRGADSGRQIRNYRPSDYDPQTHRLKEPALICRPHHFERLQEAIVPNG